MSSKIMFNHEFMSQLEQLKANCKSNKELCRVLRQLYGGTSDAEIMKIVNEMSSFDWLKNNKPRSKASQSFDALFNL